MLLFVCQNVHENYLTVLWKPLNVNIILLTQDKQNKCTAYEKKEATLTLADSTTPFQ